MEVQILLVLVVFMGLFMGGGVMIVKGILAKRPKQWMTGLGLLALCLVFMYILKHIPGLY